MTVLELLSDVAVLLVCAAAAAGCFALNGRVRRLASTERGIGKAVSEMSGSVARFETLLAAAEESTREASAILDEQLVQARKLVARLEAIAGAATPRKAAGAADPLADVVPKGASMRGGARRAAEPEGEPNGALRRLADLARQRAAGANGAGGSSRSPQA